MLSHLPTYKTLFAHKQRLDFLGLKSSEDMRWCLSEIGAWWENKKNVNQKFVKMSDQDPRTMRLRLILDPLQTLQLWNTTRAHEEQANCASRQQTQLRREVLLFLWLTRFLFSHLEPDLILSSTLPFMAPRLFFTVTDMFYLLYQCFWELSDEEFLTRESFATNLS